MTKDILPKSLGMEKSGNASGAAKPRGEGGETADKPGSNSKKHDWIGRQLQRAFEDVAREPVPDDILNLLNKLDGGEPGDKGSDKP